jgi:phosphoglycolate phosphatase
MPETQQKFNAILFDLDGTLLDTLQDLAESTNRALQQMGYPTHPVEAYKYFVGDGVKTLIERALPEHARQPDKKSQCLELARLDYSRCWSANTKPYPGIIEMLERLQERKVPMVIFSNKPDEFTKEMVAQILGDFDFEVVCGAREGYPIKPDPMVALQIAEMLGVAADEFIYLGDTNTDMQTANTAGMYAVGVLWGFREADELLNSGAKIVIEKPAEVLNFFGIDAES